MAKQIKKILLITPPFHSGVVESAGVWMNVGFVYIAGSLRAAGYGPVIYDAMSMWHSHDDIRKRIADERPDVVAHRLHGRDRRRPEGPQIGKRRRSRHHHRRRGRPPHLLL